ncbi:MULTISPECIES: TlpA disulfide reductase family protein [Parabacteroides]|uniref:TlpA family protein disulfide reductase n=1 Tax=Parabacteroides leei TaxID=2939491 RepID=UPI001899C11F|nr:TlpA disulfide reductase family protein [Parabacteroides goldsteinii]
MKQILSLLIVLLYCTTIQAKERVVELPAFDAWSSTSIEIQKIVLSDTATIVYIDAFYRPNMWIKIAKDSYLQADGKQYKILSGIGMEPDKEIWMPESGTYSFQMIFPPLPENTTTVDFTEGDFEGSFSIWGIHLDGKPAFSPLAGKKNPKESPVLETPELKSGIATLKGHIAGFRPEMKLQGSTWAYNPVTGDVDENKISVDNKGDFTLELPLNHISVVNISANFIQTPVYLKPGETTSVEINFPEICRAQSKLQKDKPSLGEKYYFSGALAALNNEVCNGPLRALPVGISSQEDYDQMFKDVATMNIDQFKQYWLDRREKGLKELDKYPHISDAYRKILVLNADMETAMQLMGYYVLEYAYRRANNIPRDSAAVGFVQPVITAEYYDFVPRLVPNDPIGLYASYYSNIIRSLQYANISGQPLPEGIKEFPDNTADLAKLMGTDKGILFDLIAAQRLARPIQEFKPLTDEELTQADKISPVIKNILATMNNKLKQTIEENKKKSGYTVDRVNIADVPAEELFNAITTPYRGKVVFVDFWATWCGPCRMAMQQSEPVKKEFEGKDVVFLYLAGENSPKGAWEQMIPDIKGEHYRVTSDQWDFWGKKFGINGVPSYMVLAKDGTPVHFQVGFMGVEKMKEMIEDELKK